MEVIIHYLAGDSGQKPFHQKMQCKLDSRIHSSTGTFSALCFDQPGWHWVGRLLWLPPLSSREVCKQILGSQPFSSSNLLLLCSCSIVPQPWAPPVIPPAMVPCWGYHSLHPVTSTLLCDFIAQSCTFPCSYSLKTFITMSTKSFWAVKYSTVTANVLTWSS